MQDERLVVSVAEGRQQLAASAPVHPYDLILVDVATDAGVTPQQLATVDFYALCRARLVGDGVLVLNFLETGAALTERLRAVGEVFGSGYQCTVGGNTLVFAGTGSTWPPAEIQRRAQALQAEHRFGFLLPAIAAQLQPLRADNRP